MIAARLLLLVFVPLINGTLNEWTEEYHVNDRQNMRVRYAQTAVSYDGGFFVTHGYLYDTAKHKGPTWLSDTWRYDYSSGDWDQVRANLSDGELGPSPRYAHASVAYGGYLYLFGGEDGGYSLGVKSYQHNIFGDMWRLKLPGAGDVASSPTPDWEQLSNPEQPETQLFMAQHSAVVIKDKMYTFGGLVPEDEHAVTAALKRESPPKVIQTNKIWEYTFVTGTWREIVALLDTPRPSARFGVSLVAIDRQTSGQERLCLFGGFARGESNKGDLWCFHLANRQWELISEQGAYGPEPRGYYGLQSVSGFNANAEEESVMYLFGGARCEPGCVCSGQLWSYSFLEGKWKFVYGNEDEITQHKELTKTEEKKNKLGDWPVHRYKLSMVLETATADSPLLSDSTVQELKLQTADEFKPRAVKLYVFGGESYRPSGYYNDLWLFEATPGLQFSLDVTNDNIDSNTMISERDDVTSDKNDNNVIRLPGIAPESSQLWFVARTAIQLMFLALVVYAWRSWSSVKSKK